jgi:hypothetical protein
MHRTNAVSRHCRNQPLPMFGRLPWFALERRRRALRFFVFFDIGTGVYGAHRCVPPGVEPLMV